MISIRLIYIRNSKKNKSYQLEDDLIKRLNQSIKFDFKALSHKKKFSSVEELMGYEGNLISKELDRSRTTICFDKEGDMLTSKKFSEVIFNTSGQFNLVIGGTYGLSNEIKLKADRLISFSDMEFAHDLFRLMLLEQLYRGQCIKTNHPYHQNEK
jgi:23S rRNA (pseudouridine1915-N3)-methyltransferase